MYYYNSVRNKIKIKGFDIMMNNVKFENKTVKNINVDLQWLPKLGLAKKRIDRNAIIAGVKAGNKYVIPFTITFTDYSQWNSKFSIVKMFKDDTKKDIVMIEEDNLGQFGVLFNSLMSGTFKGEMQNAYDRMVFNKNTYAEELDNVKKQLKNQEEQTKYARQANVKKDSEIVILKSEKAVIEMELEETKYQLAVVNTQVEAADSELRNRIIPLIVRFAKKDMSEMEIISKLVKMGLIK
jgi:hypothetical protein